MNAAALPPLGNTDVHRTGAFFFNRAVTVTNPFISVVLGFICAFFFFLILHFLADPRRTLNLFIVKQLGGKNLWRQKKNKKKILPLLPILSPKPGDAWRY